MRYLAPKQAGVAFLLLCKELLAEFQQDLVDELLSGAVDLCLEAVGEAAHLGVVDGSRSVVCVLGQRRRFSLLRGSEKLPWRGEEFAYTFGFWRKARVSWLSLRKPR